MAILDFIFGAKRKATIGVMQFDASISEVHTRAANITEFPVESGAAISDHIRPLPMELTINGIVTNHPILFLGPIGAVAGPIGNFASADLGGSVLGDLGIVAKSPLTNDEGTPTDRAKVALDELERIRTNGEVISVVTSLDIYPSMAIEQFAVQRDARNGNCLNITITLKEIRTVFALELDRSGDPADPADKKTSDAGKKTKKSTGAKKTAKKDELTLGLTPN